MATYKQRGLRRNQPANTFISDFFSLQDFEKNKFLLFKEKKKNSSCECWNHD